MRFLPRQSSKTHRLALTLVLANCLAACTIATEKAEPEAIGVIVATTGSPSVVRNSRNYILDLKSLIYEGDIVQTSSISKVAIEMTDKTRINIGAESHILFHEYEFHPGQASPSARITLSTGSMKVATRFRDNGRGTSFEIGSPVATINIRGGDAWCGLVFGENRLDVLLQKGRGLSVTNDHGSVTITAPNQGTTVLGGSAPQLPESWSKPTLERAAAETRI